MSFNAKNIIKSMIARGLVENGCFRFALVVDASTDLVELSQSGSHAPGAAGEGVADSLRRGLDKPDRAKLDKTAAENKAKRKAEKREANPTAPPENEPDAPPENEPDATTPERQHSAIRGK